MRRNFFPYAWSILFCFAGSLLGAPKAPSKTPKDLPKWVAQASLIFPGKVARINAKAGTITVRADGIPFAPDVLKDYQGLVTLRSDNASGLKPGQAAWFFASAPQYGDELQAAEIAHLDAKTNPSLENDVKSIREHQDNGALDQRVRTASRVIAGKVISIGPPEGAKPGKIGEHDPIWTIAVIQPKGKPGEKVVIQFVGSTDIHWRGAPKLKVGQNATFLAQPSVDTWAPVVTDPLDVQPLKSFNDLKRNWERTAKAARCPHLLGAEMHVN